MIVLYAVRPWFKELMSGISDNIKDLDSDNQTNDSSNKKDVEPVNNNESKLYSI